MGYNKPQTPPREIRRQKKVDVQTWSKDPETGEKLYYTKSVLKASVPTRVCVKCERTDLYCTCG